MLKLIGVVNSDKVNKHCIKFAVKALESAYDQNWQMGIPSFLNHDILKPLGWTTLNSLHLEPGMVRTASTCWVPETAEEIRLIEYKIQQGLTSKINLQIEPFREVLKEKLINSLSDDFKYHFPDCAAIIDSKIVERTFPDIFDNADKHGLVELSKLNAVAPGIFERDGLLLFAHPFFRRSLSRLNSLNSPFLEILQGLSNSGKLVTKIALDRDMIGLASTLVESFEFQYWRGPKYSDDLNNIPYGVTHHEANESQKMFTGISATEFWWYKQDSVHTLECEEVIEKPSLGISDAIFGCRYVHSMLDQSGESPVHIDGAIRLYSEDLILNRWEKDISQVGKNTDYNKIWRVDGQIEISEWKDLITNYFRDNYLIGEYFSGEEQDEFRPQKVTSLVQSKPLDQYVPCHMERRDGIRVSIAYKTKPQQIYSGIKVRAVNSIEVGSEIHRYIERDTLEIVKAAARGGLAMELPTDGVKILAFEDLIVNFPLFLHRGQTAVEMANNTIKVIGQLCSAWVQKGDDRVISYNIGVEYQDREIYYSFAGHVDDLKIWFDSNLCNIPTICSELGDWCESLAQFLSENFQEANDKPNLGDMLTESGNLIFDRRFLSPDQFTAGYDTQLKAVTFQLALSKKDIELYNLILQDNLIVAPVFELDTFCSNCNIDYKLCNCSKYLDDNVHEEIQSKNPVGVFWTKRNADERAGVVRIIEKPAG